MKNKFIISVLVLLLSLLLSCNVKDKFAEKNIEQNYYSYFKIEVDKEGTFSETKEIHLISSDLDYYKDYIEEVIIKKVGLKIKKYSGGNDVIISPVNSSLRSSSRITIFEESSIKIADAFAENKVFEYDNLTLLNEVSQAFMNEKKLTARIYGDIYRGSQDSTDVFTIEMIITADISIKIRQ